MNHSLIGLHFILNTFINKTYSYSDVNIPKVHKRVTAKSYGLNRLDNTITDRQNINWSMLRSV